jgi:hypothetical protein
VEPGCAIMVDGMAILEIMNKRKIVNRVEKLFDKNCKLTYELH